MNYPFELLHFNPSTGQVTMRSEHFDDVVVDVPIEDGKFLAGEPLMQYLKGFVPQWHVERTSALRRGVDYTDVAAMCVGGLASTEAEHEPSYAELRERAYPPLAMYLDGLVKGDVEQMEAYIQRCKDVKAMYPKPEPVLVSQEVLAARREL